METLNSTTATSGLMLMESDPLMGFKAAPAAVDVPNNGNDLDDSELMDTRWLKERFSRHVRPKKEEIIYEFTQDPGLLHQYYVLRAEALYGAGITRAVLTDLEDEFDAISHIMVARQGRHVIGGYRIVVRAAGEDIKLPMEVNGFDLREALPELQLRSHAHAEISRLAITPDYREPEVLGSFIQFILKKCLELNLPYSFCSSPPDRARIWRKLVNYTSTECKARISNTVFPPSAHIYGDTKFHLTIFERIKTETGHVYIKESVNLMTPA